MMLYNIETKNDKKMIFPDKIYNLYFSSIENLDIETNKLYIRYNTWIKPEQTYLLNLTNGRKSKVKEHIIKGIPISKWILKEIPLSMSFKNSTDKLEKPTFDN